MENPLVSVVTANYNTASLMTFCLETLKKQSYPNIEHIVVDDGSNPSDITLLKNLSEEYGFSLYLKTHEGLSAARNHGIQFAKGKYILPLDSDDELSVNWILEAVQVLDKDESLSPAYSHVQMFGEMTDFLENPAWSATSMLQGPYIPATALYRKDAFDLTEGYDKNLPLWEDYDFWLTLMFKGYKGILLPKSVTFYYNIRKNGMTDRFNLKSSTRGKIQSAWGYIKNKHTI